MDGPDCDCDDSLNAQKKEGRKQGTMEEGERGQHGRSLLLRKFGMDHRNRPRSSRRKKGNLSLAAGRNRTELLLQCFVGSLSEGAEQGARSKEQGREGEGGRTQSKFDHDMQMTASLPFRPSFVPCCAELSPLRASVPSFPFTTGLRQKGRTRERTNERTARFMARKIGSYQSWRSWPHGARGVHLSRSAVTSVGEIISGYAAKVPLLYWSPCGI